MNLSNDYNKYLHSKKIHSKVITDYSNQFIDESNIMFQSDIFNRLLNMKI